MTDRTLRTGRTYTGHQLNPAELAAYAALTARIDALPTSARESRRVLIDRRARLLRATALPSRHHRHHGP
jgi:hypothetical protein